jgi:hypothetical protein
MLAVAYDAAYTQVVQFAAASALCESTNGERGHCNVTAGLAGAW